MKFFNVAAIIIIALFAISINSANGKVFTVCGLANELANLGVPKSELRDWICLVDSESSFNTHAQNHDNTDGSSDWGLFQINDRYWCKSPEGKPGKNICGIHCTTLLSSDIAPALKCAQKIKKAHNGFSAWVGWVNKCQGSRNTFDISHCF